MRFFMRTAAILGIAWAVLAMGNKQPFDAMVLVVECEIVWLAARELEDKKGIGDE